MTMSPHALTKFVTNIDALVAQRARGMITDEEYFTEILAATIACQQTSELHENMGTATVKPQYVHDCDSGCVFLGHVLTGGKQYDAYMHPRPHGSYTEYIARASSEGSDYLCRTDFGDGRFYVADTVLDQVITLAIITLANNHNA